MRWAFCLALLASLGACGGPAGVVGKALTGGTRVFANGQAGQENVQTIGKSEQADLKIYRPVAERIEQVQSDATTSVREVASIETFQSETGWSAQWVFGAMLFPSPLGVLWWPIGRRMALRVLPLGGRHVGSLSRKN